MAHATATITTRTIPSLVLCPSSPVCSPPFSNREGLWLRRFSGLGVFLVGLFWSGFSAAAGSGLKKPLLLLSSLLPVRSYNGNELSQRNLIKCIEKTMQYTTINILLLHTAKTFSVRHCSARRRAPPSPRLGNHCGPCTLADVGP